MVFFFTILGQGIIKKCKKHIDKRELLDYNELKSMNLSQRIKVDGLTTVFANASYECV